MVKGRTKKFTGEVSLTGQPSVMKPKKTVGEIFAEKGATVSAFIRQEVGEGIEKQEGLSFAEEEELAQKVNPSAIAQKRPRPCLRSFLD